MRMKVRSFLVRCGRVSLAVAVLGVVAFTSGCAPVAPYERGKLAHPTMSAGSLSTMGEEHLHAISEGATGGSGGTGSGCGCN
ncbi:MAG: DUF4266 domain-containing protein [Myxococcales bacterium]|jgi:hypothetical protein|nr:DUF4266 domain-containing protein [Myxococcales bacterium]